MTQRHHIVMPVLLALLITGVFPAEVRSPMADLTVPTHSQYAHDRYRQRLAVFADAPLATHDIVFLGDSITEQGGDWATRFDRPTVKNRGISGDTTDGVLLRMNEILACRPAAVFIMIGVNDLLEGSLPVETIAANTIEIARQIRRECPETAIHVQTVLPTDKSRLTGEILDLNRIVAGGAGADYTVIDLHSHFAGRYGWIEPAYTTDGVHLSPAGYELWVSLVRPYVEDAAGGDPAP